MRSLSNLIGVALIVFGILALGYQGFTYTKHEQIAQLGNLNITTETHKTISFPPILGGASVLVGLVLVIVGNIKRK